MARIAGVNLPREKRTEIGLTYIYGIGRSTAHKVCGELTIDQNTVSLPALSPMQGAGIPPRQSVPIDSD